MTAILALLPQLLPLLPTMGAAAGDFIAWVRAIRLAAQQTGEWTPELEAQFLEGIESRSNDPAWRPRKTKKKIP